VASAACSLINKAHTGEVYCSLATGTGSRFSAFMPNYNSKMQKQKSSLSCPKGVETVSNRQCAGALMVSVGVALLCSTHVVCILVSLLLMGFGSYLLTH